MNSFRKFHLQPANNKALEGPPRSGQFIAAKFTEDDCFYRARVRRVDRTAKEAEVLYVDYGNSETIPFSRMRPLAPQFDVGKLKPQAIDAVLSFIQFPTQKDYAADAIGFVQQLTADKQLVANVDWISPEGVYYITLYDPNSSDKTEASLNAEIVEEGLATANKKPKAFEKAYPELLKVLREHQEAAMTEHRGMWEYGDPTEDPDRK